MQMGKTKALAVAITIMTAMVVATLHALAQQKAPAPVVRVGEPEKFASLPEMLTG